MYPFSYTELRLIHDEKVRHAMERACVDAELVRNSRRTGWLSLSGRVFRCIRSRLNVVAKSHSRIISSRPR